MLLVLVFGLRRGVSFQNILLSIAVLVAMIPLAVLRVWRFGGCAHARGGELLAIPIEARAGAIKASD